MTWRLARVVSVLAILLGLAFAQAAPPTDQAPLWTSLSKSQQTALAPLQRDWASIDTVQKEKWLEVAGRFSRMPQAERQRVQGRMVEWARMSPSERTQARMQFQESRELTPDERRAKWQAYQALPEAERKRLAQHARPAARPGSAAQATSKPRSEAAKREGGDRQGLNIRPVNPILVQAAPGATTSPMSGRAATPHRHAASGPGKIAASPSQVDPATLLPAHGSRANNGHAASAASVPSRR